MHRKDQIKELANRLRLPEKVKDVVLDPKNCNPDPLHPVRPALWDDLSLAGGFPSMLLLMEALQREEPTGKWDEAAHLYVLKILEIIERDQEISFSLYGGFAGICFALLQVSQGRTRYQRLLQKLEDHLIENVKTSYFLPLHYNLDNGLSSRPLMYDVVSGITGIGLYGLLCLDQEKFVSFTEEIVLLLTRLVCPLKVEERSVPGWYLPSEMQFLDDEKKQYPEGNFNAGLAHGIPGVLGFLSLALEKGICVPGQKEAIETIVQWLLKKQQRTQLGIYWPGKISWKEELSEVAELSHCRDAWCYGTPGVVRSLYLAGDALKDEGVKNQALLGIKSVFERDPKEWRLYSPTICHGLSGLLLISHLLAQDTQDVKLQQDVKKLETRVWDFCQPETAFGFQDYEQKKAGGFAPLDKAGMLEGATGVLLTLLTVNGNTSSWHYPLLISKSN